MKIEKTGIESLDPTTLLTRQQARYVLVGSASDSYLDRLMDSGHTEVFCGQRVISARNLLIAIEERQTKPRGRPKGSLGKKNREEQA